MNMPLKGLSGRLLVALLVSALLNTVLEAPEAWAIGFGGERRSLYKPPPLSLEGAKRDLKAQESAKMIKVNLKADVLFDFDKASLKPTAEPTLSKVAVLLDGYPDAKVVIEGHTDSKGADAYNLDLSNRRAQSVKGWLASHTKAYSGSLTTHGWGESKPIAPNTVNGQDNPTGRAQNRRVEITILK